MNGRTAIAAVIATTGVALSSVANAQQAAAPSQGPMVREGAAVKVSEHVFVIPDNGVPGVPNVGIVVGRKATLVDRYGSRTAQRADRAERSASSQWQQCPVPGRRRMSIRSTISARTRFPPRRR